MSTFAGPAHVARFTSMALVLLATRLCPPASHLSTVHK